MKLSAAGMMSAVLSLVMLSSAAVQSQGENADTASEGRLPMMDRRFAMASALGNMMEIDHGRLASRQGSTEQVRRFGERMVAEHTRAQRDLMNAARNAGMMMPSGLDGSPDGMAMSPLPAETLSRLDDLGLRHMVMGHQETTRLLSDMRGPQFDTAYLGGQIKAHAMTLADYEFHAQKARDGGLRDYAARYAPAVQDHLMMARQIAGLAPRAAMGTVSERVAGTRFVITPYGPFGPENTPRIDGVPASDMIFRLTPAERSGLSTFRPRRAGEIAYISYLTGQPVSTVMHWYSSTYSGDMRRMSHALNIDRSAIARAGETLAPYFAQRDR